MLVERVGVGAWSCGCVHELLETVETRLLILPCELGFLGLGDSLAGGAGDPLLSNRELVDIGESFSSCSR